MDIQTQVYVTAGVLGGASLVLFILTCVLFARVGSLQTKIKDLQASNRLRVQKLKMEPDKNYAYHNPTLSPDEELTKRGYSMYMGGDEDLESGRGTERQTGGQFLDELSREIESRHHQNPNQNNYQSQNSYQSQNQTTAPPFLLQAIEENKRKSRTLNNPVVNRGRASETNPNFIY